jgi:hypothetical protein
MKPMPIVNLGKCRCRDRKKSGAGPGGTCVCPACGTKVPHAAGEPCTNLYCPACGSQMIRSGLSGLGNRIPTMPFGTMFR